jgi:hypothetical protein
VRFFNLDLIRRSTASGWVRTVTMVSPRVHSGSPVLSDCLTARRRFGLRVRTESAPSPSPKRGWLDPRRVDGVAAQGQLARQPEVEPLREPALLPVGYGGQLDAEQFGSLGGSAQKGYDV